ncbi:hypothetical protein [Ralstonia sp.]|uniref:hypothetical protein n=1 Tax=Ralstonia sp. TaxID=54061 RepID=UPI00257F3EEA|nr:hypothetical protein [Ralstonia sp.]MBA4203147.1 hypothetical protein [Ralstonia sp.]MBA4279306.1 hypothetical protein [Ralstonia sp.]
MIDPTHEGAVIAVTENLVQSAEDPARERRRQHVKALFEQIDQARKFDADARKQYARDRRYGRGDTSFDVDSNIVGTFVEILTAFLYARDPDVDVLPSESASPPDADVLMKAAELQTAGADPFMQQMAAAQVAERYKAMQDSYRKRQADNKAFAETLTIVVSRLWRDARLKRQAKRWVRSALTVGVGWLKASWQTRTAPDPVMRQQINDVQDNIQRLVAQRAELEDPQACGELDLKRQQYEQALAGMQAKVERVIARGFVVDMVPAEDVQVAIDVQCLSEYVEAPWISHRTFIRADQAKAMFGLDDERLKKATRYSQRKPVISKDVTPAIAQDVSAEEADQYVSGPILSDENGKSLADCVRVEELWSRDDNRVYTLIEGLDDYAREPWSPKPTTRFFPLFMLATSETDGQRHPQSLTSRSYRLIDEYGRVRTAYRDHRKRTKPKTAFNAAAMDEKEAVKLAGATEQEMVALRLDNPATRIQDVLSPIQYAVLDPALYETQSIMSELERIWGVQEALSQAIATPKTATEAEIQQTGFHARTGSMRDAVEDVLAELSTYTSEVALTNMSRQDAQHIAGPDAFWPENVTAEELTTLVNVEIRAGSSGKPNTSAEREAWTALLPLLQEAIQSIAQLRQSSPLELADKIEALLRETANRAGDRIDIDRLIPQPGAAPAQPMPGMAGDPSAVAMPAGLPPDLGGQPPTTAPLNAAGAM